jgi:hypothetical protein
MTDRNLSLVRFITARQADLRGLREVVFAGFICVAITLSVWQRELGVAGAWLLYLALFIVVQEAALQLIDRRYDSTYGRVNPAQGQPRRSLWARTTTTQSLIATGAALDIFTGWFPAAGVSAFSIVIALHGLWIALRDFPWRLHYLAGLVLLAVTPAVDNPSRIASFLPAYFAGANCLILTGLLDHLLLASAMTRLRRQGVRETSAQRGASAQ